MKSGAKLFNTFDVMLSKPPHMAEVLRVFEVLRQVLPGLGMDMVPNIVTFRVSSGDFELIGKIAFRVGHDFEKQALRIVQRFVVPFGQRVISATQGVNRTDKVERRFRVGKFPNATGGGVSRRGKNQSGRGEKDDG